MEELVNLLTGPTARRALFRRDIAEVFRILRDAGVSQVSLARAPGQQQSDVSEIISGRHVQSIALLERIADGLGMPRGWMGLAYTDDAAARTQQDARVETTSDDNLLRHAAAVLWGKPVFGPADPISIKDVLTPVPRRIGTADIEHVAVTTDRLGQLTGDFGGMPMTAALTAHARASEALLSATMRDSVRQRLLVAIADVHRVAGSAAADAGLSTALPHVEGRVRLALGRFSSAAAALSEAGGGSSHMLRCKMHHFDYLATAQLRSGEVRFGLNSAGRAIGLAKRLRSVSVRGGLAPLQEAAAARRDSACQDLAREVTILRRAA
ncbi:MAG: hypothetical protein ABR528_04235 [Pseudonocardiaceae bacterium]